VREIAPMGYAPEPDRFAERDCGDARGDDGRVAGGWAREKQDSKRQRQRDDRPALEQPSADPRDPVCICLLQLRLWSGRHGHSGLREYSVI
jgi:hypothetical protein